MLFNSLGSNYDPDFVLKSLFRLPQKKDEKILLQYLKNRYSGDVRLLYKGREAIKLALLLLDLPKNTKVGVTGFTCFVVVQAIREAGYIPDFIDIDKNDLNFSVSELKKHKDIKVLIVQNTLGIPCDMTGISKYCREKAVYLIEDLAHSIGIKYDQGKEAGTAGDFTALSFSQDKSVDGISGGALVIRNNKFTFSGKMIRLKEVKVKQQIKDRFYPLLTAVIRNSYGLGIGKLLHLAFKKLDLLSKPVEGDEVIELHKMPYLNCRLVYDQYIKLDKIISYRNKITKIYNKNLGLASKAVLRWPLITGNRYKLISELKLKGIFISDIWYDAPVAPAKLMKKSGYLMGSCPVAEDVSDHMVNLPTHINISVEEAERVAKEVKKWINTN